MLLLLTTLEILVAKQFKYIILGRCLTESNFNICRYKKNKYTYTHISAVSIINNTSLSKNNDIHMHLHVYYQV